MASSIEKTLVETLLRNPSTEKEQGWNNAIIHLLKMFVGSQFEEHFLVKKGLKQKDIEEIDDFCRENLKLQAVKKIKEISLMGLKESKDVFDEYYASNKWRKNYE